MQLKKEDTKIEDTAQNKKTKPEKSKPEYYDKDELPKCINRKHLHQDISGKCYEVSRSKAWGIAMTRVQNPTGKHLTYEQMHGIRLPDNFPKIPWALWERWVQLCFELCKPSKGSGQQSFYSQPTNEVQVTLLRKRKTFDEWKFIVPKQEVSKTRVDADLTKSCDIVTGEIYDQFPPEGWVHAGSSHSHNTMKAFFSPTDDDYELKIPGVHIVNGEIDVKKGRYVPKASIAFKGERKDVSSDDIINFAEMNDFDDDDEVPMFHPNCLNFISIYNPPAPKKTKQKKGSKGLNAGFSWDEWSADQNWPEAEGYNSDDYDYDYDDIIDNDPQLVSELLEGVEDLSSLTKAQLLEIMEEKMDSEFDYWWEND